VLVGWSAETHPNGPLGPRSRLGLHQFLDAVLPEDPGAHPLRDGRGADRELTLLLRLTSPDVVERVLFEHGKRLSKMS